MANYPCMYEVRTVLYVGDTVTSPSGNYVMTLANTGLAVTYQGGSPQWITDTCLGVTSCKLMPSGLTVYGSTGWQETPVLTFTPYVLDMQDNGQVVIYNGSGSQSALVFSYNSGLARDVAAQ